LKIGKHITPADILDLSRTSEKVYLDDDAKLLVEKCYAYVQDKITRSESPIYGVNTGFGSLCDTVINHTSLEQLQVNLLLSHACGMGEEIPSDIVRIMLLIKALSLSKGHSGVQVETIEKLLHLYNEDILPIVYEQGSLGASGDLAPLAHLSIPLIGEGTVRDKGVEKDAIFLADSNFSLRAKEGLALINGTQFMGAFGVYCTVIGIKLVKMANRIAALSVDAFDCRLDAYHDLSHTIRNQNGQMICAKEVLDYLGGSTIAREEKSQVQDPYSFRCIPQVHGASLDVLLHAEKIFDDEINAVTDNPNVFPDEDLILSAGNFHGQTLAIQLDTMAIALAELANISERRTYKLVSGERGLPSFLIENAGLNSGFMIPQYTAASIVSQNKQYCSPASTDSIVSSNGQEDHVSMGANAATKCYKVLQNAITVLSIELQTAAQALEFRRPSTTSPNLEELFASYREVVPMIEKDAYMHPLMKSSRDFVVKKLA
jgi:histidine ammonia-lyase